MVNKASLSMFAGNWNCIWARSNNTFLVATMEVKEDDDPPNLTATVYITGERDQQLSGTYVINQDTNVVTWKGKDDNTPTNPFTLILSLNSPDSIGGFYLRAPDNEPYAWVCERISQTPPTKPSDPAIDQ
jgi:hypothetical protein